MQIDTLGRTVRSPARRKFLRGLCAGAGVVAFIHVVPRSTWSETLDIPDVVRELLNARLGDGEFRPGRIEVKLPVIAETGFSVPITFRVDSPMTEQDHATRIMGIAPGNPEPFLADYFFTPEGGRAEVSTRIRLARSQTVVAAARLSDGSLWATMNEITVTLGACVEAAFLDQWAQVDAREARRRREREANAVPAP